MNLINSKKNTSQNERIVGFFECFSEKKRLDYSLKNTLLTRCEMVEIIS